MTQKSTVAPDVTKQDLIDTHWDMYKDAYGVRPRFFEYENMTIDQLVEELDSLQATIEAKYAQQQIEEAEAAKAVELYISTVIQNGANDRATAIRWLHEAHDTQGDDNYLEYQLGLKYGYFSK